MDHEPAALTARLVVLERNRVLDLALLAMMPIGVVGFAFATVFHRPAGSISIDLTFLSLALRWALARQSFWTKNREREVTVSSAGVLIDGKLVPRADISDGWFQPKAGGSRPTIQLFDRRKRVAFEAEVTHEGQAIEMLRALGLDASRRRAEFRVASALSQHQWNALAMIVAAVVFMGALRYLGSPEMARMGVPIVMLACLVASLWPMKIVVGRDAITTAWLGVRRFYPLAKIRKAMPDGETRIALVMDDWTTQFIYTSSTKHRGGIFTQTRDALLARICEALDSHRELEPGADLSRLVGRAGRSMTEWKSALAALDKPEAGYRESALRTEDLWRVVEDPRAPADTRAGAALVLQRSLDEEGRARVRVAAEATASPKLRIALTAASDGREEEALAALESLDAPAVKPLRAASSGDR